MKKKSIPRLVVVADKVFSEYIRKSYSDKHSGFVTCITCNKTGNIKDMHNGHYHKRSCFHLRYDERNAHPQCPRCNLWLNGNQASYALFLTRTYGENILEILEVLKNQKEMTSAQKRELCEGIIETYTQKVKDL